MPLRYTSDHWHESQNPKHDHAFPMFPHSHVMRAVCNKPMCDGFPTHNIHATPRKRPDPER